MTKGKGVIRRHELDPTRRPWEKQPWETAPSFNAFAVYRDLGLTRSLIKAAQAIKEAYPERKGSAETIRSQLSDWSAAHLWQKRCDAYDLHVDARMREQREGRIDRQNRRYETAAASLSSGLLARIALNPDEVGEHKGQLVRPVDLNELDAEAVARVLVSLQRIERLATGQPTELAKGAFLISSHDVERIVSEVATGLMQFVPEDRQPLAAQWIMAYARGAEGGAERTLAA
jgi:hypothetical protein